MLLAIITFALLENNVANIDIKTEIPLFVRGLLFVLLFFEVKASRYLIYQGFNRLNPQQIQLWENFKQSCLFGIMLLFNIVWRSYTKMIIVVLPFLNEAGEFLTQNSVVISWPFKILVYTTGAVIVFGELLIIRYSLMPEPVSNKPRQENLFRLLILIFTAYFSTFLSTLVAEIVPNKNTNILSHLPQLLILFFFFYLPFRWIEVLSDLSSCTSKWQQWLWGVTSFGAMTVVYF